MKSKDLVEKLDPSFKISYAQNREDIILFYFFKDKKKGFYIDVGAGHPDEDSVTKLFYDMGWSGVNIEPIKRMHKLLEEKRPRDINLNIGLSDKKGRLSLREYENYGLSTFTKEIKENYSNTSQGGGTFIDYEVEVDRLDNVLNKYPIKEINFLKVDVEGLEYEVLIGNNWEKYRPQVLCVESNHIIKDWRPLLNQKNYLQVFNDGINDYFISKEFSKKMNFSYVDALLGRIRPIDYRVANVFSNDRSTVYREIDDLISRHDKLFQEYEEISYENSLLKQKLDELRTLKYLGRSLFIKIDELIREIIYPSTLGSRLELGDNSSRLDLFNKPEKQLAAINDYDKKTLTGIKTRSHPVRKSILMIYVRMSSLVFLVLKKSFKLLKKIKRRMTK